MSAARPAYRQLPNGNARGVFGANDVFGCLNLLTAERVKAAAAMVRTGQIFSLNGSLMDWPNPSPFGLDIRPPTKHVITAPVSHVRDDYLDGYYLQSGTQWDHFMHHGECAGGFYNDMTDGVSGIGAWADKGIVGRGVLLDLARWREKQGKPVNWRSRTTFSASDLEQCAKAQKVEITEGTILIMRFGWESGYAKLSKAERHKMSETAREPGNLDQPGLEATTEMAARLWDWGLAAIAGDNPAMEAYPMSQTPTLHELVLSRLGMPFGEFWLLDALAAQCAAEGRYEFFVTSAPLNVPVGVGSPANVLAIL